MRALVLHGPGAAGVVEVPAPVAGPGEVVVDVERAGVCGTDVELFTGEMAYLHEGEAGYPLRPGHEWCGVVSAVGDGVAPAWVGRRVTGDTTIGCGRCGHCRSGRKQVCADRVEIGIRRGRHGALAEQLAVPADTLHALPEGLDAVAGALVEPGGNALRAAEATQAGPGDRVLVCGTGTIGLLTAWFLDAAGARVELAGESDQTLGFARALGRWPVHRLAELPVPSDPAGPPAAAAGAAEPAGGGAGVADSAGDETRASGAAAEGLGDADAFAGFGGFAGFGADGFAAVVDASSGAEVPARAVRLVAPGGRVVCIGLAGRPSLVDTREVVLADLVLVGVLGAQPRMAAAAEGYATGAVDPRPLVAQTVGLDAVPAVLAGRRPGDTGRGPVGPKTLVDPRQ